MIQVSVWQKKHTLSSSEYIVSRDNELLYRCVVRYLSGGLKLALTDAAEREVLNMKFPLKHTGGSTRDKRSITADGIGVGQFYIAKDRGVDPYFCLENGSLAYTADAVGFGADGLRIMVFDEECQVALIDHPLCINERVNEYNVTTLVDAALPMLILFSVYYDCYYLNKPKYANRRFSPVYCYSSKRQRAIFDPNWLNAPAPAEEPEDESIEDEPVEDEPVEDEPIDEEGVEEELIEEDSPVVEEPIEQVSEEEDEELPPAEFEMEPLREEDAPEEEESEDEPDIPSDVFEEQARESKMKRSDLDKTLIIENFTEQ